MGLQAQSRICVRSLSENVLDIRAAQKYETRERDEIMQGRGGDAHSGSLCLVTDDQSPPLTNGFGFVHSSRLNASIVGG